MRIILIRHGQTHSNIQGALDTAAPGAGLTELGHAQAAALPAALGHERIAAVYASPRLRTHQTAQPLAAHRGMAIEVVEGLEEISAGAFEMRSDEEAHLAYAECLARWMDGDLSGGLPAGEDGHQFRSRFDRALLDIAARHQSPDVAVAIFSHGAAIRAFTTIATGNVRAETGKDLRIMNTGGSVLVGEPGVGWELERWSMEPFGGSELATPLGEDVTGESVGDVRSEPVA